MPVWLAVPFVIVVFLFFPLWFPLLIISVKRDERRLRQVAESFACLKCGAVLGVAGIELANQAVAAAMDELRRQHPDCRFRVVRTLHAICPACGTRYTFLENERTFAIEQPGRVGE